MRVVLVSVWVTLVLVSVSCSDDDDAAATKETGALPCNASVSECRASFEDDYEGTYTGDAAGRVIFGVDSEGYVFGTVTKNDGTSDALDGTVNEFGRIQATASDGTKYDGQLDENHRFTGTWTAPDGSSGTFSGSGSSTPSVGSGGTSSTGGRSGGGAAATGGTSPSGGASSTGGAGSGDPATDPRFQPTLTEICAASVSCGSAAECEEAVVGLRTIAITANCIPQLNVLFTCQVANKSCSIPTHCPSELDAFSVCVE